MPHRHPVLWAVAIALLLALVSVIGTPYLRMSLSTRGALSIAILCVLVVGVILGAMRHHGRL
jgi:amino acid transporter